MPRGSVLFCALSAAAIAAGLKGTVFDASSPAGFTFHHENSPTPRKHLIETMGGGVALLDYNNDGLLDIFLVNSGHLGAEARESFDRANPRYWNCLFRQNKDGSITDVTARRSPESNGHVRQLRPECAAVPGQINVDTSLSRIFAVTEHFQLEARAEAFNAIKHANFKVPKTSTAQITDINAITASTFGLRRQAIHASCNLR